MAIDWARGYAATWHVYRVDAETWADAQELPSVRAVSVSLDASDRCVTKGSMTVDAPVGTDLEPGYYRVAMVAEQDGSAAERQDVATLWCESTGGTVDHGSDELDVIGLSVLEPAKRECVPVGTYVPRGADGPSWVADTLRGVLAAPVTVADGGYELAEHVVIDPGTTIIDAVWQVLDAGGWILRVAGDGTVAVVSMPTEPALLLDRVGARMVRPGIDRGRDLSTIPNRYYATQGALTECAVNDDPDSPVSTVRRGHALDVVDTKPVRINGETLYGYCARKLEEASVYSRSYSYDREWWPDLMPHDIVRAAMPDVGMVGDLRVTRQSLACGHGIVVTERAEMEEALWQR